MRDMLQQFSTRRARSRAKVAKAAMQAQGVTMTEVILVDLEWCPRGSFLFDLFNELMSYWML